MDQAVGVKLVEDLMKTEGVNDLALSQRVADFVQLPDSWIMSAVRGYNVAGDVDAAIRVFEWTLPD